MTETEKFCGWVRMSMKIYKGGINEDAAERLVQIATVLSEALTTISVTHVRDENYYFAMGLDHPILKLAEDALSKANEIAKGE